MPEMNSVDILVNGVIAAESVQLEYCMVFARAILDTYYNDPDVEVLIRKHEEGLVKGVVE